MKGTNAIRHVLDILVLQEKEEKTAFLGFDACIDNIAGVVSGKTENGEFRYFETSRQFAGYINSRGSKSCGIELSTRISKLGGNMAITANALGTLGIKTDCAGTFGLPDVLPFFRAMSSNCSLYTVGETITATALEFEHNKVILFDPGPYNNLTWESLKSVLGLERLKDLLRGKDLVAFLNWSEIIMSTSIWEGFMNEVFPSFTDPEPGKIFFTDLSDCSRRTKKEISDIMLLLRSFRKYFRTAISLNQNEADLVASALGVNHSSQDEYFVSSLYEACGADVLVIHRNNDATGSDGRAVVSIDTFHISKPVILTGGGDNFNAGFCLALLEGMDLAGALLTGNAVAACYVGHGSSPDRKTLIDFLRSHESRLAP